MNKIKSTTALLVGLGILLLNIAPVSAGKVITEVLYDDFSGGEASYAEKWSLPFYGVAGELTTDDGGALSRDLSSQNLDLSIPSFTAGSDFIFFDHIKYLGTSNDVFAIPSHGSISFSMDMSVKTPGAIGGRIMHATELGSGEAISYAMLEGRQACASLHMLNFHETGQLMDWLVSETKAIALTERLFTEGEAGIGEAYTQIVGEIEIEPGTHNYAIRYTRVPGNGADKVEWLIDGEVVFKQHDVGVPLDKQSPGYYKQVAIIDPSQGEGELLKKRMDTLIFGHGIFSLLDVFPYQQAAGPSVTIPVGPQPPNQDGSVTTRLWGQGVVATYDNARITIRE